MVRRSSKSLICEARVRKAEIELHTKFSSETEYSFSTDGLLLVLLDWACVSKKVNDNAQQVGEKAAALLRIVVDAVIGKESFVFESVNSLRIIAIASGLIDCGDLLGDSCLSRCGVSKKPAVLFGELLLALGHLRAKHSQLTDDRKDFANSLVRDLVLLATLRFELVYEFTDSADMHLDLPMLRLKSHRPRRIPVGKNWRWFDVLASALRLAVCDLSLLPMVHF